MLFAKIYLEFGQEKLPGLADIKQKIKSLEGGKSRYSYSEKPKTKSFFTKKRFNFLNKLKRGSF